MGTYEYDLWGNPVTIEATTDDTLGITEMNPLRYRGYYYDRETKFYYLNARYNDPEIHRFISADSVIAGVSSDVIGYNLFAYCDNDPVNKMDSTGNWSEANTKFAIGFAIIGTAALATVCAPLLGVSACAMGMVFAGALVGSLSAALIGGVTSAGIAYLNGASKAEIWNAAYEGAADGCMWGAFTGGIGGIITGMNSCFCFLEGTLVETIDGPIPIEQIEEGEFVLSADPETGDVTYKRVIETYVNETTELIHLNVDGEEIVTTPAHPFYVKDLGFVLAGDLEEGTTLVDNVRGKMNLPCR